MQQVIAQEINTDLISLQNKWRKIQQAILSKRNFTRLDKQDAFKNIKQCNDVIVKPREQSKINIQCKRSTKKQ